MKSSDSSPTIGTVLKGAPAPSAPTTEPPAVIVKDVSKSFRLHTEKRTTLKERFVRGKGAQTKLFHALDQVSFDVPRGQTWALIGHNGSGKSTMLKLLAGVHRPNSGSIVTNGRVSALLELGAGFHAELTGRENIYLNASILGLSRRETERSMDRIIEFAALRPGAIDEPVKTYSSGMYVRLGFAIAVTVDPEILIVDEIIAVGDEEFQRKCFDHLFELRRRGTTIIMVSHAMGLVQDLCDGAVWLDHGRLRAIGESRDVVRQYLDDVNAREASARPSVDEVADESSANAGEPVRPGSGEVRIESVEGIGPDGEPLLLTGEPATFRVHYRATVALEDVVFGLGFIHESGVFIAGPNSGSGPAPQSPLESAGTVEFRVPQLSLQPGLYELSAAAVSRGHTFDYVDRGFTLRVRGSAGEEPGLTKMFGHWRNGALPEGKATR